VPNRVIILRLLRLFAANPQSAIRNWKTPPFQSGMISLTSLANGSTFTAFYEYSRL
jgi:hypothetical protein